jgi:serine/threonine protein kinase
MASRRQSQLDAETKAIDDYVRRSIKQENVYKRYDEGDELGSGAFGRVWKGVDLRDGDREFAIKTISCPDERALGREVRVMLEADHPNLVQVHEIYRLGGDIHLVMDLVEPVDDLAQSDLFEWVVSKGPLNTVQQCKLLYQTADSLSYLNRHNTIHRDLKPENILLGPELFDRVRVTDYGLARVALDQDTIMGGEGLTADVGSDGYQAPETMGRGRSVATYGKQCDVWSMGVVMYIVCSGSPPFGLGGGARKRDIMVGKYRDMAGRKWSGVTPEMKELIRKMLIVDPAARITVDDIMLDPFVRMNAGLPPPDPMELSLHRDIQRTASEISEGPY